LSLDMKTKLGLQVPRINIKTNFGSQLLPRGIYFSFNLGRS
jgi:hypothetical protein